MSDKKSKEKKLFAGYTEFFLAKENYAPEKAPDMLRETLRSFRGIRPEFLRRAEEADAFRLEKKFVPVYCLSAHAEYVWEVGGRKGEAPREHREERRLQCVRTRAPEELRVGEWKSDVSEFSRLAEKEIPAPVFADSALPFSENARTLKRTAADYSPDSTARISLEEERFEVIFVPVLSAVCVFGEREYRCFVNLHNGVCSAEYPVSERVEAGVEKTLRTVRTAKLCVIFSAAFILAFAVLGLIKRLRPDASVTTATIAGLFAPLIFPVLALVQSAGYQREKLRRRAGNSGRWSGALPAVLLSVLSGAAALFSLVLFAVSVL